MGKSKKGKQPGPRTRHRTGEGSLTSFGVVLTLPIFAAIFALFPRYLESGNPPNALSAFIAVLAGLFYLLSAACLLFTVYGFLYELHKSPQMKRFLKKVVKNILTKPVRTLFDKPTNQEGLQNGSIAILLIGIVVSVHLVLINMTGLTGTVAFMVRLVLLPFMLVAALAIAATIDAVAIKPILMTREQRRKTGVGEINLARSFNQLGKVFGVLVSLFSALVSTAELIPRLANYLTN